MSVYEIRVKGHLDGRCSSGYTLVSCSSRWPKAELLGHECTMFSEGGKVYKPS